MATSPTERRHSTSIAPAHGPWMAGGKRLFDIVVGLAVLVLLSPILLLIALAIVIESPASPFFVDERVGLNGAKFRMWKFRSMTPNATEHELGRRMLVQDPRVTRVGGLLRRTSLDELLQAWNILVGDMSVVGPRPGLWEHGQMYDAYQRQRLLVRPGVTGLAQISGRNNLTWGERIEYDLDYIGSASMLLDLRILLATVGTVVTGRGISSIHQQRKAL